MFKKILSLALVAMLLMSVCAVSFSAAQVEVAVDGADTAVAEQGADSDAASQGAESGSASTGAGILKFDNSGTNWAGPIQFYVYCPEDETKPLGSWGSKKLNGTDEGGGIWSYDASALESGKEYCIIFYDSASTAQTYDLMLTTDCFGDTAKATGNEIENPVDSNKKAKEAKWTNSSLGPRLQITSIGNVVGETCPSYTSKYDMFVSFLKDTLDNARKFSGKKDQELIDGTAKALGIGTNDIEAAIKEAGVTTEWSKDSSSQPADSSGDAKTKGSGDSGGSGGGSGDDSGSGDDNKDSSNGGSDSSGGSSNSSGGSSGGSSSGSSSGSKSGSASNTQTGQTETVLFIMLGVMVAAAGVIFFARKKERT